MRRALVPRAPAALVVLIALGGCARYEPRPIDPSAHPAAYASRRLDDPALQAWVRRFGGDVVEGRWTGRQLGLVALAHRADLERARRDWLAARAGVVAAGGRPAPGVQGEIERRVGGRDEGAPWVVGIGALFTLELGGKRAARIQAARAEETTAAAELALAVAGALGAARVAGVDVLQAEEMRQDAEAFLAALRGVERGERERFAEASLGSGELARTASEVAAARSDVAAAEREVRRARAGLASALAVPVAQVERLAVERTPDVGCAWSERVGGDSVIALALRRRGEIARALAAYATAEADVRQRVAAQVPDLELGPGFIWDQGVDRWTLSAALPALLGLRRKAPVAAAEARRHAAAARVDEVQDELIGEVSRALESCRGASLEATVADSQRVASAQVAALARAAYERGEHGRLDLARAELLVARADAAGRAAGRSLERAGLELELAAGEWAGAGDRPWPDPRTDSFTPDREPQ
jgi:outer membrane protein TolC